MSGEHLQDHWSPGQFCLNIYISHLTKGAPYSSSLCKQVCSKLESFIEFTIPRANQNPVMQKVCPIGLYPLVHLARDVLCILLICLVHLILNVPVNNFSVVLGQGHRFLGITNTFGE